MGQAIIRESTADDIKTLVVLCKEYFNQSPYNTPHYAYDEVHTHDYIRRCVINPHSKFFSVVLDNKIVGLMCIVLGQINFQLAIRAYLEYIYVLPEYRTNDLFKEMIEVAEQTANDYQCIDLLIGDVGFNVDAFTKKMKTMGFDTKAVICRKAL